MNHPRVWAALLFAVALVFVVPGYNLAILCYVPTTNGCFAVHDATEGVALLIIAGLLVLAAVMLLTAGRPNPIRGPFNR